MTAHRSMYSLIQSGSFRKVTHSDLALVLLRLAQPQRRPSVEGLRMQVFPAIVRRCAVHQRWILERLHTYMLQPSWLLANVLTLLGLTCLLRFAAALTSIQLPDWRRWCLRNIRVAGGGCTKPKCTSWIKEKYSISFCCARRKARGRWDTHTHIYIYLLRW